ncbi:putative porin [Sphaerotilus hippei]|uniref:Putative porin n=1 Tax=Sphaerotilus hippei TaxID=744406 RepID=A0A318H2V5_9BURK|nr:porin [Sphaerotilus hippei]PXW97660.1 putative porin [Sphaerotilus hippei]
MKPRHWSALGATTLLCTAAAAQQVTLYGLIDVGVERISNVGAAAGSLTRMPSTGASMASRWGVRGSEDLGGGTKAGFTLESGFGPDTGTLGQGGRAFGRQAFLSLSGDWGQISAGRQYTMLFWGTMGADLIGPNAHGLGSLDSYIPNARVDNSLAYRGSFRGVSVGATYSLGRDVATAGNPAATNCPGESASDPSACRAWSWMLKYDQPAWGAAIGQDQFHGAEGSWAGAGLLGSGLTDRRTFVNGYGKLGDLTLGAGLMRRSNDGSSTPRSDLAYVAAAFKLTPTFTVDGMASQLEFRDAANGARLYVLRGTQALSRRTAAYVSIGHVNNRGASTYSVSGGAAGSNAAAGGHQNGVLVGVRHSF